MQGRDRLYALKFNPNRMDFLQFNEMLPSHIKMYCYTFFFLLQFSHVSAQKYLGLGYGI